MTVVRRVHTRDYTIIGNDCLRDEGLSAEALGVICYLRGRPDDWTVRQNQLADRFKCGRDRIIKIMKDLIEAGYIKKVRSRDPVTQRWGQVEFIVLDTASEPLPENTVVASEPLPEKPLTGKPLPEKPTLLNTDLLPITDIPKIDSGVIDRNFETFWEAYPERSGSNPKAPAKASFTKAVKAGTPIQEIVEGAIRLGGAWRNRHDRQYIPQAVTWLNQKRWQDNISEQQPRGGESFFDIARELREAAERSEREEVTDGQGTHEGSYFTSDECWGITAAANADGSKSGK